MIREVKADEVPIMAPLAVKFYGEGDLPGVMDPDRFIALWTDYIEREVGFALGAWAPGEGGEPEFAGGLGALVVPAQCDGILEATEMFWYLDDRFRGHGLGSGMMDAFEESARKRGAKRASMVHLANEIGEKVGAMYVNRGYRPVEIHYFRDLEE